MFSLKSKISFLNIFIYCVILILIIIFILFVTYKTKDYYCQHCFKQIDNIQDMFDKDDISVTNNEYDINKDAGALKNINNIPIIENLCIIGDSIYSKKQYNNDVEFFYENADEILINNITNLSEPGAGFCSGLYDEQQNKYVSKPYYIMVEFVPKKVDTILIFLSFNDVNGNYEIGSIDDDNIGTICGSFNYIINKIMSINPNMKVIVFSPIKWLKFNDNYIRKCDNYVKTIEKLCEMRKIIFCDLYENSKGELDENNYCKDKIHINKETHSNYVKSVIIDFLKNVL